MLYSAYNQSWIGIVLGVVALALSVYSLYRSSK